jgi:hypothetical protein
MKNNYPTFDITPQFAPSNYLLLVFFIYSLNFSISHVFELNNDNVFSISVMCYLSL